uniref:Uncharacterized protein n=1 Tax=Molossus molossus TaxID=27622 RepID=A0A7J8JVP2_MOLMO|nr:hypothetical protein HJG59_007868 [Molossus molossus]
MIHFPDFVFGDFYPCPSAICEHLFAEVTFSVSITPRLTHPSLHLYPEIRELNLLESYTWGHGPLTVLYYGVRIRSTTQPNLATGREIWPQGPCDQFYLEDFADPVPSQPKISFPHFICYF